MSEISEAINSCTSLQEVMDNSYDSIFVTDGAGNVLMVNPAAERGLNMTSEQLLGRNVGKLAEQGFFDKSIVMLAIRNRTTVTDILRTKTGNSLLCTCRPIFDASGNIMVVISNSREWDKMIKIAQTLDKERTLAQRYKDEAQYMRNQKIHNLHIVAESPAMKALIHDANIVGPTETAILLTGESGTGKEVIANYVYSVSNRATESFISINCSAIPENLIEAELFGYERGAFTGADARGKSGLFELADNGTVFLDEIGDMPLHLQAKFLRVLELGEVRRICGTRSRKVNFRLICATNRDLKQMVSDKQFREDLYYRINVVPLHLSPLRDRPDDIIALSSMFLESFTNKYSIDRIFDQTTIDSFLRYAWPGNVRELRNLVERLVITSKQKIIIHQLENLSGMGETKPSASDQKIPAANSLYDHAMSAETQLRDFLEHMERDYIECILSKCDGNVSEAARFLGIDRSAIYRKIKVPALRRRRCGHAEQQSLALPFSS